MGKQAKEVSREELAINLLKRASSEIQQLSQQVQHQGAQLLVFEKIAKIAGWTERPQGMSPDICWEIERMVRPPHPGLISESE